METKILGLFLPAVFILHNVEEYRSFEDFKAFYLKTIDPKFCNRKVFLYALIILTLFVSGICVLNYSMSSQALRFATTIINVSLLLNGIQHIVSSLWMRKFLPGTISAAFLLIPCSLVYLVFLAKETHFGIVAIVTWVLLSIIVMFVSIRISLWLGYLFFKRTRRSD